MRKPDAVKAPRLSPLVLEGLADAQPRLLEPGADLDDLAFKGIRGGVVDVSGSTTMNCEFNDVAADELSFAMSQLAEVRFRQFRVPLFRLARSVLRDVEFDGGRLGAVEAYDLAARAVHFKGCRINYLNLRASKLYDVAFTDCHIDELDLGQVSAQRLCFTRCKVGVLSLHGNTFTDVDFRGAELDGVNGAASLKGAVISPEQLVGLAPQFAKEFGIRVASGE